MRIKCSANLDGPLVALTQNLDVTFSTHDGVTLRGRLYLPDVDDEPVPGIVMTHGFSATTEMGLVGHADLLVAAGYAVLLYDHRALGASDGDPRGLVDPFLQARDMMVASAWLSDRAEIDATRIGLWGTSYSGGEAIILAAVDPRVRAVATIVPMVAWPSSAAADSDTAFETLARRIRAAEVGATNVNGPFAAVPDPGTSLPALLHDPDTTEWMLRKGACTGARWRNEVLTPDWSNGPTFDPQVAIPHLHAPVLMIVGSTDRVTPASVARAAASHGGALVELIEMEGHHCTFYQGEPRRAAAAAIVEFFNRRL